MFAWIENLAAQQAAGLIRHFMSTIAGALVAKGLVTDQQSTAIVGGFMALLAVVWSLWQKHQVGEAFSTIKDAAAGNTAVVQAVMPGAAGNAAVVQAVMPAAVGNDQPPPADLKGLY